MTYLWLQKLPKFIEKMHVTIFRHFMTESKTLHLVNVNCFTPRFFFVTWVCPLLIKNCAQILVTCTFYGGNHAISLLGPMVVVLHLQGGYVARMTASQLTTVTLTAAN